MSKYERFRKFSAYVGLLYFVFMAYMLLHPKPPTDIVPERVFSIVHFLAFAALGCLVGFARRSRTLLFWFGSLLLWGAGSEVLQKFTGRYFEWLDIVQNTLGATFGLLVAARLRRLLDRREEGAIAILARPPYRLQVGAPFDLDVLQVLVIRRSSRVVAPGALCFPGGHVEPGESAADAARREFREEVGLDVAIVAEIARNRTPSGKPLTWFLAEPTATPFDENAIRLQNEEVASYEWRSLPDLVADPDFLDNNREIVQSFIEDGVLLSKSIAL